MNLEVNLKVPRWIVGSGSLLVNKLLPVLRKIYHGTPMGRESKAMRAKRFLRSALLPMICLPTLDF